MEGIPEENNAGGIPINSNDDLGRDITSSSWISELEELTDHTTLWGVLYFCSGIS